MLCKILTAQADFSKLALDQMRSFSTYRTLKDLQTNLLTDSKEWKDKKKNSVGKMLFTSIFFSFNNVLNDHSSQRP